MTDGWAPALAGGANGHWVSASSGAVYVWSGHTLERSVELAASLGGPPRVLADGRVLAGRFAVDPATGEASERIGFDALRSAFHPQADPGLFEVREVAWSRDGNHALVFAELVPTRLDGAEDELPPGSVLEWASASDGSTVKVLERDAFLSAQPLAGDRWLVAGGDALRAVEPGSGEQVMAVEFEDPVSAVATSGDIVAAALSGGTVAIVAPPDEVSLQRWRRHGAVPDAIALSPDATLVASGDRSGDLQAWTADGTRQVLQQPLDGRVDGLCFLAPDHLVVAVGGTNRQLLHLTIDL